MIQNKRLERRFYDLPKGQRGVNSSQAAFVRGLGGLKGIVWDELLQLKRTRQLESILAENSKPEIAESLFAHLFGHHRESSGFHSGINEFSASLLLRLVKMAYTKIKQTDDNVHDGSYQSKQRDNAERGRGSLLNALLAKEGPDAWAVKIEMANDPIRNLLRSASPSPSDSVRCLRRSASICTDGHAQRPIRCTRVPEGHGYLGARVPEGHPQSRSHLAQFDTVGF